MTTGVQGCRKLPGFLFSTFMDKPTVAHMERFSDMMFELYELAEGLRDSTADGKEKEIFNKTRGALYDLRYEARDLYYKWHQYLPKESSPLV